MAKIKITDLPRDYKISKEEMEKVMGGFNPQPEPPAYLKYNNRLLLPAIKGFEVFRNPTGK